MSKGLTVYLNDHLSGSLAALELLEHLETLHSGIEPDTFTRLQSAIEEDQQVLRQLLQELGGKGNPVRKAAAWLTEKLGQAKLRLDQSGNKDLGSLEALEVLGLGIQGKLSLWRALAVISSSVPQLRSLDFEQLQRRGLEQFERVEGLRLRFARTALTR